MEKIEFGPENRPFVIYTSAEGIEIFEKALEEYFKEQLGEQANQVEAQD